MKKSLITHIVVMVIAVAISSWLASSLITKQMTIAKSRDQLSKTPMGGFNKFASDVQWMLFINYCGSIHSVKKDNAGEIYSRLNTILRNDPDFEKAYSFGGMMLSVKAPVKSVEILMRGADNPNFVNNWKLPFLAGFVLIHNVKDEDWNEFRADKKLPDRLQTAEDMFKLAIERGRPPEHHVVSALLRTKAKRIMLRKEYNGVPIVNNQHAYLCALFEEWRKNRTEIEGYDITSSSGGGIHDINNRILIVAQDAKASNPENEHILKMVETVVSKVLTSQHLCETCISPYKAGEKFCSDCGLQVAVYGVCDKCGSVICNKKFCSSCGKKNKTK